MQSPRIACRRTLMKTAAWSVPAISVITTAPTYASSAGTLTFDPQSSGAVVHDDGGSRYFDFEFAGGAYVLVDGDPKVGAPLTLTVSFTPYPGALWDPDLYVQAEMPGWTSSVATGGASQTLLYSYQGAVAKGDRITIPDGVYFGPDFPDEGGTYLLVFALDRLASASTSFATARPG
jgi:hypothetical protein